MIKSVFQVGLAVSAIFIGLRVGGDLLRRIRANQSASAAAGTSA